MKKRMKAKPLPKKSRTNYLIFLFVNHPEGC